MTKEAEMNWIVFPDDEGEAGLGGKAGALRPLSMAGLPVPAWFCITPAAFRTSLDDAQRRGLAAATADDAWRAVADTVSVSPHVARAIDAALGRLCPDGAPVAVRSSASDEDGVSHSFAGQLDSFLFVPSGDVADRVARVWRSGFSERVASYRRSQGIAGTPPAPAVLVQRMISPDASGVAFAADPVSGDRDVAVIAAVYGVGSGLVSGECDADTYRVDREGRLVESTVAHKRDAHRPDPQALEGVRRVAVPDDLAHRPVLTEEQVREVAALARRATEHFGRPQDIEWAYAAGRLYLLQSRPVTGLANRPDPGAPCILWDNSNIAESYPGVTTPLTFSFARRAYEHVYREFCHLMRVPAARVLAHEDTFRNMVGLVHGRIYYNLLNWYRVLALLPGFTVNRAFMEQMMGVKEGLPDALAADLGRAGFRERLLDSLYLARTLGGLLLNHAHLRRSIVRFYGRLDTALASPQPPLEARRPDELVDYYRALERELLTRWDAPLVNDFFAMVFYGVLKRLCERWCDDTDGTLQNDLLCGEGGMISAEPAQRIRAMAELAAPHPEVVQALAHGSLGAIRQAFADAPALERAYAEYLERFGDRCLEELKLESTTLHDDPLPLLRAVGAVAERRTGRVAAEGGEPDLRARAEKRVAQRLRGSPVRRAVFGWVLGHARARVRDRENLRFERTRLFGRVRRIFLEIGKRLYALDRLEAPRDVFYLTLEELLGFVEGTACTTDLEGLVRVRKAEFEGYRTEAPPPDRIQAHGIVYLDHPLAAQPTATMSDGSTMKGTGCCPGVVRGRVRVVTDPRGARLEQGEILVAARTDPGWIMLFPAAAGLLVEHGSLLSHSAIVARELGLPAIVGLSGVTRWLADGDRVEMDGASGHVRRLEGEEA